MAATPLGPGSSDIAPHGKTASSSAFSPFGDDGISFRDVIDVINPLHHVPVLGTIYRRISGDVIDPAMRVAGGALFGGPIGAAIAAAGVMFKAAFDHGASTVESSSVTDPGRQRTQTTLALGKDSGRPHPFRAVARGGWMVASGRPQQSALNQRRLLAQADDQRQRLVNAPGSDVIKPYRAPAQAEVSRGNIYTTV